MSDNRRDHEKFLSSTIHEHRNSKDDNQRYHRKRTRSNDQISSPRTSNIDAKVYVGNVPTDNLTDSELLEFFKPFGKVSDIRVYKGYIFVQYDRVDDARRLIKEGQTSLILKGNKLDILPAMEGSQTTTKSSSNELFSKNYQSSEQESLRCSRRHSNNDRHSSNYEPPRKRYHSKHTNDHHRHQSSSTTNHRNNYGDSDVIEIGDDHRVNSCTSRTFLRRSSRSPNGHSYDSSSRHHQPPYTVLKGPDDSRQLVDCQIILVNPRQRSYGEEIASRLICHGLVTSIILLREDYTLIEAIENATHEQCLYGIIAMPMHEERRTASFHILYGETEEHRNLTLEDGFHIILTNFARYKELFRNENSTNHQTIIYPEKLPSREFIRQEQTLVPLNNSTLSVGDKLPLSMLLCLLADGRQLTLDEIDRILVYLLEKKAKMLTLPQGTLPPLPAQYASVKTNHQTGSGQLIDSNPIDSSSTKTYSSAELSSTIAEQIRQILATNNIQAALSLNSNENLSLEDIRKKSNTFESSSSSDINKYTDKNNLKEGEENNSNHYQQIQSTGNNILSEQQKTQTTFSYPKSNSNSIAVVAPSFHYASSSSPSTTTNGNSLNYPSYDSTINSPLKQTKTSLTSSNLIPQSCEYFFPPSSITNQNLYQTLPNTSAADAAAAIFQAYTQFNARSTPLSSMINQQTNTQQQQQTRK